MREQLTLDLFARRAGYLSRASGSESGDSLKAFLRASSRPPITNRCLWVSNPFLA